LSWLPGQTVTYLNQEAEASQAAICKINVCPHMKYRNIKLGWTIRHTLSCKKLSEAVKKEKKSMESFILGWLAGFLADPFPEEE
jgi:hypothetical protein